MAKKLATAIDIGADSVKVVRLEETSSGIKIANFGMERYPRPDAEVSDDTIASTLRSVLSQADIKTKSAVISVPRALVTQKKLNFQTRTSALTEEEIDEMVALQAEVEIPFGAGNAIYDYHNIQKSPEGMSVELVAARKETIARYLGILKSIDLQADAILPSTYAISATALNQLTSNSAKADYNATAAEEHEYTIMVIDIGAEYTDLCILRGNRIVFSRSFPVGGNLLTEAYAKERGLSYENAEEYKISNSNLEIDSPEAAPTYKWAEKLSEELQLSIQAFSRDMLGAEKIDSIWICGCGATIPGLDRYIADSLEIPAELWNPLAGFESTLSAEPPDKMRYAFAVSLGLALNAFTNQVAVNLLPVEEVQRKEKAKQRIFTLSYAAAALILIVGISIGVNTWISSRNAHLEEVSLRLQAVQKSSEQARNLLIDDLVMTKMLSPRVSPLDILKELSENFPDRTKIALTNFTLDRTQKITLNVEANSHAEISNLISTLGKSKLFTEVKSGQISTTEKQKGKPILQTQVVCKLSNNAAKYVKELKELAAQKSQSAPRRIQDEGVIRQTSMRNPE